MTAEDLAAHIPQLFHVTAPGAADAIARHGLLSASAALAKWEQPTDRIAEITQARRPQEVAIDHPVHGRIVLNDNIPLSYTALERCLDDGLTPRQWLAILNARVFFWPNRKGVDALLGARTNRHRARDVLVFDTLGLARAHHTMMELSPINSGSTIRKPARRGLATFTPIAGITLKDWRGLRGGRDDIREVTIPGSVPDAAGHLIDIIRYRP